MSVYDSSRSSITPKTIALLAATILLALGFAAGLIYLRSARVDLRAADLCPVSGPTAQTIVLLDVTDPLNEVQSKALDSLLADFRNPQLSAKNLAATGMQAAARYVEPHQALAVYLMDTTQPAKSRQLVYVCNPGGDPAERTVAQELTEGAAFARARWATFEKAVQDSLPRELRAQSQTTSPLLEAVAVLVEERAGNAVLRANGQAPKTRLILFSDMVQNSESLSHFRELPRWEELKKRPAFANLATDLTGIEVEIVYLRRDRFARVQTAAHYAWWPDVIAKMNGRVVSMQPK